MKSLEKIANWCSEENIVLVCGGPSLDYCNIEIENLLTQNSIFFLTDIISQSFISMYPESKRLVFTVEHRYHNYLRKLKNEKIAMYVNAKMSNIYRNRNEIFQYHFDFDHPENSESIEMRSPGTVAGPALYWALKLTLTNPKIKNIHLIGLDLSYINLQMYNRYCYSSQNYTYWNNRETAEWFAMLKKSSLYFYYNDLIVRTSNEFKRSVDNMNLLIANSAAKVNIIDYSPLGLSQQLVKKMIPEKIRIEEITT